MIYSWIVGFRTTWRASNSRSWLNFKSKKRLVIPDLRRYLSSQTAILQRLSTSHHHPNIRAVPLLKLLHKAPPGSDEILDQLGLSIEGHDKTYNFESTDSSDSRSETQSPASGSVINGVHFCLFLFPKIWLKK